MTGIERVAVVVPAADEQDSIGACLDAIAVACAAVPHVRTDVVVVLDNCRDSTAAVVATHPDVTAVLSEAGNVGAARAAGSLVALTPVIDPARTWLAHTDADSTVPAHWLEQMLLDADTAGADLVLGTVLPDDALDAELRHRWLAVHDQDDGHGHVHGANLGIRGSAYLALGGFRALPTGEDVDLVARAVNAGLVVSRSGRITVTTSSRAVGRAPEGFAGFLHEAAGSA